MHRYTKEYIKAFAEQTIHNAEVHYDKDLKAYVFESEHGEIITFFSDNKAFQTIKGKTHAKVY